MLRYNCFLPDINDRYHKEVNTLITAEVIIQNFNVDQMITLPKNFNFDAIIEFIFDSSRLSRIFTLSCQDLLPGEIKIHELTEFCKKQVLLSFINAGILPSYSRIKEAFFMFRHHRTNGEINVVHTHRSYNQNQGYYIYII